MQRIKENNSLINFAKRYFLSLVLVKDLVVYFWTDKYIIDTHTYIYNLEIKNAILMKRSTKIFKQLNIIIIKIKNKYFFPYCYPIVYKSNNKVKSINTY